MAKIQRYELVQDYGEADGYMAPTNNGDYIKVSELREKLITERQELKGKIDDGKLPSYTDLDHTWGRIDQIDNLLAAIDTEGK